MGPLVVAIDGPAGTGKSSVSRRVAKALGARYLDTGAMYRALTWAVLQAGIDPEDGRAVAEFAPRPVITCSTAPDSPGIAVDGADVSEPIRSPLVTGAVSAVSAVPAVRERLVGLQRQQVADALAAGVGIVVEGRDIGSVVLPAADLKIFLTASPEERARRRAAQQGSGEESVAATQTLLAQRDAKDSGRAVSPLVQAEGAVAVDTSDLDLDQVVATVLDLARGAG